MASKIDYIDYIDFDPKGDLILVSERFVDTVPLSPIIDYGTPTADSGSNNTLPSADSLQDAEEDTASTVLQGEDRLQQEPVKSPIQPTARLVKMRVSSKHLVLASEYFAGMISNCEQSLMSGGTASEISVGGDNIDALHILLDIIHGSNRKVPWRVDLHTLCEVVVLIDKYELHEAAEVFTTIWYKELRPTMSRCASSDLGAWIYICFGLDRAADFTAVTGTAILDTDCVFSRPQEARIPHWFISGMSSARLKAVDMILSALSELVELYAGSKEVCHQTRDCDALSLGRLIKELRRVQLYPVPESASWTGSVLGLVAKLRALELTTSCDISRREDEVLCKRCRKVGASYKGYDPSWDTPASVCDSEGYLAPPEHANKLLENSLSRILDSMHGLSLHKPVNPSEELSDVA